MADSQEVGTLVSYCCPRAALNNEGKRAHRSDFGAGNGQFWAGRSREVVIGKRLHSKLQALISTLRTSNAAMMQARRRGAGEAAREREST
ncbi:hypothetical protein KC321_g54 [Hortaea werneckii]|nr:hypothetical protein KC321_g54 [Hortaea werneckii]